METSRVRSKLLSSIGANEFLSPETWKEAVIEFMATTILIVILTISCISCLELENINSKICIPFVVFVVTFWALYVTVPMSGGHMNPFITFIAALKGIVTFSRAVLYVVAQCLGSIVAFSILKCIMDHRLVHKYSLGGCLISEKGDGIKQQTALLLEFVGTLIVLHMGITVAFNEKRCKEPSLLKVCLVVASSFAFAVFMSLHTGRAGYSGVGLNPAKCLGSALFYGGSLWNGYWVFWFGPFLGCIIYYLISIIVRKQASN